MEKEESSKQSKEEAKEEKHSRTAEGLSIAELKQNLEKLILNTSMNKYDAIVLIRRWVYELKSKDSESRSVQDLIALSVNDVLGGHVSHKTIRELPTLTFARKQKGSPTAILDNIGKSHTGSSDSGNGKSDSQKSEGKKGKS